MAVEAPSPFYIGGPIPAARRAEYFFGYEDERRRLAQALNRRGSTRVGILAPRGAGKTSLILAVAGLLPTWRVHVNCHRIWPRTRKAYFRILIDALGIPAAAAPEGTAPQVYSEIVTPKRAAKGILVLENVEGLAEIDKGLVDSLPALAERLPHVLLVTGEPNVVRPVVEERIELQPFDAPTTAEFVRSRLERANMSVAEEALGRFHEFSGGRPGALQRIGLAVWDEAVRRGADRIEAADVEAAIPRVIEGLPTEAVAQWARLRGMMRDVFVAMCLLELESPTAIAQRLELEPKNVIVLLARLAEAHGLVERVERGTYRVRDPLLKHYVRKEWASPILR